MAPLKSLEVDYPLIDSDFQQFCARHGILSGHVRSGSNYSAELSACDDGYIPKIVEDFLMRDLYMLVALAEQYPTSDRLKEGISQILSIIDCQHQPWHNGLELLEDSQKYKQFLSVGCQRVDAFLHGGLQQGILTELVGPSSSGKTQVCLLAASNIAKTYLGKVMFIDTGNSFSAKRIAEFLNQSADHACTAVNGNQILPQVLDNIICCSVFDIFKLLDVLHELLNNLKYQFLEGLVHMDTL